MPAMSKEEFLSQLSGKLKKLPREEKEAAVAYYREYLEDAEDPQAALGRLGDPKTVASQIISEAAVKALEAPPTARKGARTVWITVLAVFASPIALPLALMGALTAGLLTLSIFLAFFFLLLAGVLMMLAGALYSVVSVPLMFQHFPTGLLTLGSGIFFFGAGLALSYFSVWLCKKGFRFVAKLTAKLLPRRNNAHEE